MNYQITAAEPGDLPVIYHLFEEAIRFQQANNYIGWNSYDKDFIREEVNNKGIYKMLSAENIICIFSVCYSDPLIWREMERGDAIYLHRIVLNQQYKAAKVFPKILDWAIETGQRKGLRFVRLDTWADNAKLISYYKSFGFNFIENYTTPATADLPIQHRDLKVALLALPVPANSQGALEKKNIFQELSGIHQYWSQQIIGQVNGQLIKLAKGKGAINWHKHDDQDELFIVYKGHLTIQLRDKNIELFPHELFVVPRGTEHCPVSRGESEFLIMGLNITSNAAGGRPAYLQG
jgi:mannose-6-phosphate isomerase-like protein (cupin superfamily)/ribosomal protein S18 acetylase RimI-like enzyme